MDRKRKAVSRSTMVAICQITPQLHGAPPHPSGRTIRILRGNYCEALGFSFVVSDFSDQMTSFRNPPSTAPITPKDKSLTDPVVRKYKKTLDQGFHTFNKENPNFVIKSSARWGRVWVRTYNVCHEFPPENIPAAVRSVLRGSGDGGG